MNLEEDILIERFLRKELSKEEKKAFLKRLDTDLEFKESFLLEKELYESLDDKDWSYANNVDPKELEAYEVVFQNEETKKLQEKIGKASREYQKKGKNNVVRLYTIISAVAAIFLLFFTFNFFNSDIDNAELYASYVQKEELPSYVTRGDSDGDAKILLAADKSFKGKKYKKTLEVLERVNINNDATLLLYKGISYIELGNYEKGITTFDTLIKSDLIDAEKGYWYKSLLYVRSNQFDKAEKILKKIIANNYFKKRQAEELLSKIKK